MGRPTYIIPRNIIEKSFSMADCISEIENTFRLYGDGKTVMPAKVYMNFEKGDIRCMPSYIPSLKMGGVKIVNVHPGNKGMPAVMATTTLIDPENGFPLAILDGTHITNMRTGAAGGVAAKYLSRKDSKTAAFIGTGAQARTQLEALLLVRPGIKVISAYSPARESMESFASEEAAKYKIDVRCCSSVHEAAKDADVVVTTTPAREPVVMSSDIAGGMHINAIGADAPGKEELDPAILRRAVVVIDNWEQASHSGEINVPVTRGILTRKDIRCDIGELVAGKKRGRTADTDVTVFDSTGMAIQDLAIAAMVFRKLTSNRKLRTQLDSIDLLCLK